MTSGGFRKVMFDLTNRDDCRLSTTRTGIRKQAMNDKGPTSEKTEV